MSPPWAHSKGAGAGLICKRREHVVVQVHTVPFRGACVPAEAVSPRASLASSQHSALMLCFLDVGKCVLFEYSLGRQVSPMLVYQCLYICISVRGHACALQSSQPHALGAAAADQIRVRSIFDTSAGGAVQGLMGYGHKGGTRRAC